jgi:hypothetical protein
MAARTVIGVDGGTETISGKTGDPSTLSAQVEKLKGRIQSRRREFGS